MKTETWRFERSTMTVRDGANHCLFSAKTFASGGTFDAARSADAEQLLALAAAAPELLTALEAALVAVEYYHDHEGAEELLAQVRDAIAGAKGGAL